MPIPGQCRNCGGKVPTPSSVDIAAAAFSAKIGGHWDRPIQETGWASGHRYDEEWHLLDVLCSVCGGEEFGS